MKVKLGEALRSIMSDTSQGRAHREQMKQAVSNFDNAMAEMNNSIKSKLQQLVKNQGVLNKGTLNSRQAQTSLPSGKKHFTK